MGNVASVMDRHNKIVLSKVQTRVEKRVESLEKLKASIIKYEKEIEDALKHDLGKSPFESYLSEIDYTIHEINYVLDNIHAWALDKSVSSPLAFAPAKSFIRSEPYGKVLIIGPWNYPFQLVFAPLVGALAAGNTAVIKPSEISEKTAEVIKKVTEDAFGDGEVATVLGGVEETTELLAQNFDYIFYTGNGVVGRIVMEAAAKNLTPVTLELGGKSPCLVFSNNIDISAKRIVWGKFFNAGQTCVAPDYVLIEESKKAEFVKACKKWIHYFYGDDVKNSNDYGRIVNQRHFDRISKYLDGATVLIGGNLDRDLNYIEPTLVEADADSAVMQDEIFGPVLPILTVSSLEEGINFVNKRDKPLACYGFLDTGEQQDKLINEVSSGGMVINDTIVHLSNHNLPFGGVGESGMGNYHGKYSFDIFSHKKSVMKRSFFMENSLRYPPYKGKLGFVRRLMKLIS